jgi:hypothetical protein
MMGCISFLDPSQMDEKWGILQREDMWDVRSRVEDAGTCNAKHGFTAYSYLLMILSMLPYGAYP